MTDERHTWTVVPFRIEAVEPAPTRNGYDRWRIDAVAQDDGRMFRLYTWREQIAATLGDRITDTVWLTGYSRRNPYDGGWWNNVTRVDVEPTDTLDSRDWAAIDAMLDEEAAR